MSDNTTQLEATRTRRYCFALVVMFLGGSGLVYEYCISTLATHLLGNSVQQFSVIIALMLFAMGIAGLFQRNIRGTEHLATIFIMVELGLAIVGGTSAIVLYLAFAWLDHFHLILYTLALTIGFGIGLEIPLLLRLNEQWRSQLADNVGEILSLDYVGALVGALVWAFVMLPVLALDRISVILGIANLGAAALTWVLLRPMVTKPKTLATLFVVAIGILGGVSVYAPQWKKAARQDLFAYPIRHHEQSIFQDITVTGMGARMSLYLNGRLQFDSEDEFIYHEMLVHPAIMAHGSPRKVLILGGGDGLAVREALKWKSVENILLVDLDPAVTDLARQYPPLVMLNENALNNDRVATQMLSPTLGQHKNVYKVSEKPIDALRGIRGQIAQVRVWNADADIFLRDVKGKWDVIIADFPDPSTPDLAKLYSAEFYALVKASLNPGGIFALQAGSPYTNRSAFWSIAHTIEAVGFSVKSLHAHVPTFGEWGWHVAKIGALPIFSAALPDNLKYLDKQTLLAASIFGRPLNSTNMVRHISTRVDPWVMRLYQMGEQLEGHRVFAGRAER
jgi:spermidine synthase